MKRLWILFLMIAAFALPASAQYAYRIRPMPALPATCNPLNGDVVMLTLGAGISPGVYNCTALNTWRPVGMMGNQFVIAQNTITASAPFINHTVTWNNAAVTFDNIVSNVTDTLSAAASRLLDLQLTGASIFRVQKNGVVTTAAAGQFVFNGRSKIYSIADSVLVFTNNAGGDFDRLILGPETVNWPGIKAVDGVGGQTQGIKIVRGDGTDQVFASLGAAENGSIIYCADCTVANPCAGVGTGAIAKRLNGVWVCN